MRVSSKLAVQLLEACGAVGIGREELVLAIPADSVDSLRDPRGTIEWDTLMALFDRLWSIVDGDVERMRTVGGALVHAPSFVSLRRLARTVVSARSLYDVWRRWIVPAAVPHVSLVQTKISSSRIRLVASIPEPHASSIAFLHFVEGALSELPRLLALERSTIITSKVTARSIDVVLELPASSSVMARARRAFRAAVSSRDALVLLEGQRAELAVGLKQVQRATNEIHEVFDSLPVLVVIHREGTILWKNRAMARTLGYEDREALIGRSLVDFVAPSEREMLRARMRAPASDTPDLQEVRLLRRDGQVVITEVFPTRLIIFDGKPARMIVGQDVTERVRLQAHLLVSARMASIGMLAAGVAHEVNNPLAYVLNNVEIAMKQLDRLGDSAGQGREALGVALEGVDRIRTIVRDLLALCRVDDVAVGPIDVVAVVDSTLSLARKEIEEHAGLVYEHQSVPAARGTVARLGQVLLNLLSNALESLPAGSRATNEVRVLVRPSDTGGVIVEVSDNGVGIPARIAQRIFDPFFTTKAPGRGTGLGLAISQRLVAEMGGDLSFESVETRGSKFRVTLPAPDLEDRPGQRASAQA